MKTLQKSVPGVVIHHVAASTGKYVGCPSIVEFSDGGLLASHSYFGPGASNTNSYVYSSQDGGDSWKLVAKLVGQIWSNLFCHDGELYIFGTDHCDSYGGRLNGRVVIRRSIDRGRTWTVPLDKNTGLLTDEEGWHTAPCPVVFHAGRLWRAVEHAPDFDRATWKTVVMSISGDRDPLERSNWVVSEHLAHPWSQSQWIEGNVVVSPEGRIVNILRENNRGSDKTKQETGKDRAVIVHVSADGLSLHHDPLTDGIEFPGGGTKFTIRYDPLSRRYWSLVNKQKNPSALRNRLYLIASLDLREWRVERLLLESENLSFHAFQYVDWVFSGDDILYVSRTAYDDDVGGAHTFHDANFLTFHRAKNFRIRR